MTEAGRIAPICGLFLPDAAPKGSANAVAKVRPSSREKRAVPTSGGYLLRSLGSVGVRLIGRGRASSNGRAVFTAPRTEPEAGDNERMAVLPIPLSVDPMVGNHSRFEDELVALPRTTRDGRRDFSER